MLRNISKINSLCVSDLSVTIFSLLAKIYIKTLKLCKNNKPQTTMLFTPLPAAQTLHITLMLSPLSFNHFQLYTQTNISNAIVATMITSDLGLHFYTTPCSFFRMASLYLL
jgi:hypothetical protein